MQKVAEDVAKNSLIISDHTEVINHLLEIGRIYGWIAAIVVTLLIYTWREKMKAQDKLELVVTTHIKESDKVHNKIFADMRDIERKADKTAAVCDERTKNGDC